MALPERPATQGRSRYPGAAPFESDALSRRLFFGRAKEADALRDLVLAERLVVIYARSGMGKSSLLNAALKGDLWERGLLPLMVRLNDPSVPARDAVYDRIDDAIEERHQTVASLATIDGSRASLWHYFKTTQFWNRDVLLTPVLILDQFEEIFTLHAPEHRDAFIAELGRLFRGPASGTVEADDGGTAESDVPLTDSPPAIKVVLSLREDYLGHLEELAHVLPQILQNRFRLGPLDEAGAADAIAKPAAFDNSGLAIPFKTPPFRVEREALSGICEFLGKSTVGGAVRAHPTIDPFQLQLVCTRLEEIAARKGRSSEADAGHDGIVVTWTDVGGERGLSTALASFYEAQLRSVPSHFKTAARNLCEYGLINQNGRRTSLDEDEIVARFGVAHNTLQRLVNLRLLRADPRLGALFYELSHDTLIAPILAARETRDRTRRRWTATLAAALMLAVGFVELGPYVIVLPFYVLYKPNFGVVLVAMSIAVAFVLTRGVPRRSRRILIALIYSAGLAYSSLAVFVLVFFALSDVGSKSDWLWFLVSLVAVGLAFVPIIAAYNLSRIRAWLVRRRVARARKVDARAGRLA